MSSPFLLVALLGAVTCSIALAVDPLQDFCVAQPLNIVSASVNGIVCKDPTHVVANDFYYSGLDQAGNITNSFGSRVTSVRVNQIPGLNSFGISIARIDFAPWGTNPPHTHPRATEILLVLQGNLQVGFVTSNPENRLITKVLHPGDVFVFPVGLVHFQYNLGSGNALAFSAFSSQNPGTITLANSVFGTKPRIASDFLAKAFQMDRKAIDNLQAGGF